MPATPEDLRLAPGRPPLSPGRIVDCALTLAKEDGFAAVSMRRLAKELGVQPMSLYHHIPSRAVLMVLMAERSISAIPGSDPALAWSDQLVSLSLGLYRAGTEDPAVFPVLASEVLGSRVLPPTPAAAGAASVGLVERVELLLADAGVPQADRPGRCRGLIALVVGFLVGQVNGLVPTGGEGSAESDSESEYDVLVDGAGGAESAPVAVRELHVDDPATDLRNALQVFVRGFDAGTS